MKRVLRLLPFAAAALLAARFLGVVATLARALPEGAWPVVRFGLVAAVVCLAPGLALLRASRVRPRLGEMPVFVLATSLASSGLAVWALYFCGLYTRGAALALLAILAAAGAWGAAPLLSRRTLRDAAARLRAIPLDDWAPPLVAALLLEGVFESALGNPFSFWDAVVTWDKWAADAGARAGFGAQLVGGYPQLLPAIRSLFYKIAATPAGAVLPAEQLLLHGFDAVFPAILALSLFALGRRHRFPALLAFALLAACDPFFANFASGEADVPLAAFAAATAALLPPLAETRGGGRALAPLALLFFATVFAKGTGVVLAAGLVAFAPTRGGRSAPRRALAASAVALAFALPFLAHQLWLSAHPAAREASPFLVALPLHAAHTRLFEPDFAHLAAGGGRLAYRRCRGLLTRCPEPCRQRGKDCDKDGSRDAGHPHPRDTAAGSPLPTHRPGLFHHCIKCSIQFPGRNVRSLRLAPSWKCLHNMKSFLGLAYYRRRSQPVHPIPTGSFSPSVIQGAATRHETGLYVLLAL